MPLRHICLDRWRKIQKLKELNPLPQPDNPAPQPLPENPGNIPLPPYDTPENPAPYVPDSRPETYTPVLPSGIETSVILAGVVATIIGTNNDLYPNGSNGYQPGPAPTPDPLPVVNVPTAIYENPVVIADSWQKGDDVRVFSQPEYVYGQGNPPSGPTTVADLMGTSSNDGWTGPLPFF